MQTTPITDDAVPVLRGALPPACEETSPRSTGTTSFGVLAAAFAEAARGDGSDTLSRALLECRTDVDAGAVLQALRCLVEVACRSTGETPRSLLEQEFIAAPSDEFWRARLSVREGRVGMD